MVSSFRSACSSTRASSTAFRTRPRRESEGSRSRRGSFVVRWSTCAFANFSPVSAAMSKEQTKPSESLVQDLLAERRQLKVAVERLKLELADAQSSGGGPDPRVRELQDEIERLRYQLPGSRGGTTQLREE